MPAHICETRKNINANCIQLPGGSNDLVAPKKDDDSAPCAETDSLEHGKTLKKIMITEMQQNANSHK